MTIMKHEIENIISLGIGYEKSLYRWTYTIINFHTCDHIQEDSQWEQYSNTY